MTNADILNTISAVGEIKQQNKTTKGGAHEIL